MKTHYTLTLCLLVAATGCSSIQEEAVNTEGAKKAADEVFYATLEQSGGADATKVYADENLKVLWNADDRITIYNRYTYGYEYAFLGATGKTAGTFAKVDEGTEFVTGNALDEIYAVYPHSSENDIDNAGNLTITWPSPQIYKPNSFGIGANIMVSVTDDNQLRFRNVGGYLALKLYGDNVSVSSITLRGNNAEKLSGRATITCATDTNPELSFQPESQGSLQLNCTSPVHIGSTAESATTFWLVVPPTDFTQGFNITVRTSDGLVFYKSTDSAYEIERNTLCRMAAIEVIPSDIVPFADANFKAYCVTNFDTDSDGEISFAESLAVTSINVNTDDIVSLQGVEFFKNLTSLSCCGSYVFIESTYSGDLKSLDISDNVALTELRCYGNQLTTLDVSNNTALLSLYCDNNQLTVLDVSNNTELAVLQCVDNQLTALDVNNNTALTSLWCDNNQLTALDVSNNTALTLLYCNSNQLTALDVSNNSELTYLGCGSNQLTSLDISNNTALTHLDCNSMQLAALDVSNNTALTHLYCNSMQLAALDVSNNTELAVLWCVDNQLTALDVNNNTALLYLNCVSNQLTALDVSNNTALTQLYCHSNQLTALDVSNNTALTELWCYNNPDLTEIWLKNGQTIQDFLYETDVAQIYYKD